MKRLDADVTLVDRHNHHLFQPLLYQVATAGLAPSDIAWPVRSVLARQKNLSVRFGSVRDVDTAAREVVLDDARLPYSIISSARPAPGTPTSGATTGRAHATGLKSVDDATLIPTPACCSPSSAPRATDDAAERDRLLRLRHRRRGAPPASELAGAIGRARPLHAGRRLPPHRPARHPGRARRGGRARAVGVRARRPPTTRAPRSRGQGHRCAPRHARVTDVDERGVDVETDAGAGTRRERDRPLGGRRRRRPPLDTGWTSRSIGSGAYRWVRT